MVCNCFCTIIWSFYFYHQNYWMVCLITGLYAVFYAPIIAFLEAMTIDALGKEKHSYGIVRVWGSMAFIAMVLVAGYLIDLFSVRVVLIVVLIGSILQAAIALRAPSDASIGTTNFLSGAGQYLKKRVVVFLLCAFLMLVSHGAYYGFFSIHLESLGYGSFFIGVAWALASMAEVIVMIRSRWFFKKWSYELILMVAFGVAALRWFTLVFIHSAVLILLSQIAHCVTYGLFHMASILYIDSLAPAGSKTFGQALNNAVTYGLGLMLGFLFSGYFYDHMGASMSFLFSGATALLAGLIFSVSFYRIDNGRLNRWVEK